MKKLTYWFELGFFVNYFSMIYFIFYTIFLYLQFI